MPGLFHCRYRLRNPQNGELALAGGIPAFSQVEAGRFVGSISDSQVAVVPNATVKATNVGTNIVQEATANSTGDYVITPVSAGARR